MTNRVNPRGEKNPKKSTPEKVSFVVSLLILMGLVGAVLHVWISPSRHPAILQVEKGVTRVEGNSFYLSFTVKNEGDETAQQVRVEGSLAGGGKEEVVSTTFDYIPGRSEAKGVLIFSAEPSSASVRVESYQQPA